jgi:hypothetical protein
MKKITGLMLAILIALAFPVLAQPGPKGMSEPGAGPGVGPNTYSPQNIITVKGTVENLGDYPSWGLRSERGTTYRGVILKTDQGHLTVRIGPPWYLSQEKFSLKVGDTLEVAGFKITQEGKTILMAQEVKKDGKTLKLRDEHGFPVWPGAGRGPQVK